MTPLRGHLVAVPTEWGLRLAAVLLEGDPLLVVPIVHGTLGAGTLQVPRDQVVPIPRAPRAILQELHDLRREKGCPMIGHLLAREARIAGSGKANWKAAGLPHPPMLDVEDRRHLAAIYRPVRHFRELYPEEEGGYARRFCAASRGTS